MAKIHPTAIIDPQAQLADDVTVGAYTLIGPNVRIGAGTEIGPHCVIEGTPRSVPITAFFNLRRWGLTRKTKSTRASPLS